MAKIDELLDDVPDPRLRSELRQAVNELRASRNFGLVFEDHIPEEVALPGLLVRRGSIVQNRTRPDDTTKYEVVDVTDDEAQLRPFGNGDETITVPVRDLMVVRRFGEPIYPGLTQVGEVRRGPDDKPAHAVINAENFHALQMLTYTHAGKVDVIYIDPPYNTGDKSWKYNNRFVDVNDEWRHSKWLSMMEKRLQLAKRLLNPDDSVLIVTIDEKEYLRLGMLLEQVFSDSNLQMVSSVINPKGSPRRGQFSRVDEYIFFVFVGNAEVRSTADNMLHPTAARREVRWAGLRRNGANGRRTARPNLFYAIFFDADTGELHSIGTPLEADAHISNVEPPAGTVAVLPLSPQGDEMTWGLQPDTLADRLKSGYVKYGALDTGRAQPVTLYYLPSGPIKEIEEGTIEVTGHDERGAVEVEYAAARTLRPMSIWNKSSHSSTDHGPQILTSLIPGRRFPFPKALYAVEDALRFFVADKPDALILDFFVGSGTTSHAVFRLNHADGGRRKSIAVTNNEVSAEEGRRLRGASHAPGDPEWEALGIFEHITRPRVVAAVTGKTPDGAPIDGNYRFTDKFPMSDGFEENVVFFRLDYLDPDVVSVGRQYAAIAPLLWLAAGSVGRWADRDGDEPWSVPDSSSYGVLFDEDRFAEFKSMIESSEGVTHVWLVTNSSQSFAEMRAQLPNGFEVQMLYRDYLSNFRVNTAETFS